MFFNVNNDAHLQHGQSILDSIKNWFNNIEGLTDCSNDCLVSCSNSNKCPETGNGTCGPCVESCTKNCNGREGFDGTGPTQDSKNVSMSNITNLKDEFNKTLVEYTKTYQTLMEELITNNQNPQLLKYAGKNIKYGKDYYFVNNFGFAHEYDNAAWKGRSNSCSKAPVDVTVDEFNKLLKGPNMGIGQVCGAAGYNIQNKSGGENSWVDIKGVRHIYSEDVWDNRSSSCQTTPILLDHKLYTNIPKLTPGQIAGAGLDPTLSEMSMCNTLNVDPQILQHLAKLNDKLLTLGKELLIDTTKLAVKDVIIKEKLDKFNTNMMKQLNKLQQDKKQFNIHNVELSNDAYKTNLSGVRESSRYKLSSNYLQYVLWLFTAVLLILYSFYNYSSDEPSIISSIILTIVASILLYRFGNYIYLKLF